MHQATMQSEAGCSKRCTALLLALNIIGVIGCLFTVIIMVLWALRIIWAESDISPAIMDFIHFSRNVTLKRPIYYEYRRLYSMGFVIPTKQVIPNDWIE